MIQAIFPAGVTDITVNGLHQWDYGQKLEIQADDLPGVVEVHFSCAGMDEAVVRVCGASNGVATAAIPDRCLEQTGPVTAWVYVIDGTEGATTKTVLLPIIPRTRPAASESIPEAVSDKYTEVITAANAAVASAVEDLREAEGAIADSVSDSVIEKLGGVEFSNGSVRVAQAFHAVAADLAAKAETADTAETAQLAEGLTNHKYMHYVHLKSNTDSLGNWAEMFVSFISDSDAPSAMTYETFKEMFMSSVPEGATVPISGFMGNTGTELHALYRNGGKLYVHGYNSGTGGTSTIFVLDEVYTFSIVQGVQIWRAMQLF